LLQPFNRFSRDDVDYANVAEVAQHESRQSQEPSALVGLPVERCACNGSVGGHQPIDEPAECCRRRGVEDREFSQIRWLGTFTGVCLEFPQELQGVVVVVGRPRGPGEQFLPVNVPLLVDGPEVNQIAPEAARGECRNLREHQIGQADHREAGDMFAGLVFLAMPEIGPGDLDANDPPPDTGLIRIDLGTEPADQLEPSLGYQGKPPMYRLDLFVLVLKVDIQTEAAVEDPVASVLS